MRVALICIFLETRMSQEGFFCYLERQSQALRSRSNQRAAGDEELDLQRPVAVP